MAASTITRDTWTNDSGTAANPAGDGTILNNTVLQNHIYARIDEMFAGAGSYATFTFGGKVAIEGTGTVMNLSGGVSGAQEIAIRNTSAGATNYAAVKLGNDGAANVGYLAHTSSSFTATGSQPQDGLSLRTTRAGGVSIAAEHVSGIVALYSGGTTERARLDAAGALLLGDSANARATVGMTINQGANDDEIISLKSSDVAHGITDNTETDTFGLVKKANATSGGVSIQGFDDGGGNPYGALTMVGALGQAAHTAKSVAAYGVVRVASYVRSGTGLTTLAADGNLASFDNAGTTRFILDGDGDSHQDVGTAWTNFDDHEDIELLHALSAGVSRKGDPLRRAFGRFLTKHRRTLERAKLVTFNDDGHHFINWSRTHMLTIGAVRQISSRVAGLERRLRMLEA